VIKVQDSADFGASFDGGSGVGQSRIWFDELIPDSLMPSEPKGTHPMLFG
jgi:hypothetical protein